MNNSFPSDIDLQLSLITANRFASHVDNIGECCFILSSENTVSYDIE